MSSFRGFYINLDRNQARAAAMTQHLAEVGMSDGYERYAAVDGSALGEEYATKLDRGNLGLWLTHQRLISANLSDSTNIHILEDDAVLPKDAATCFPKVLEQADRDHPNWDILFTEIFMDMGFLMFQLIEKCRREYQQDGRVQIYPVKNYPLAGTSSLFISGKSLSKYLKVIAGQWTKGMPIDLFLRNQIAAGALNAYITLPFTTTLSETTYDSDIRGSLDYSRRVLTLYRAAMFKDADVDFYAKELTRLTSSIETSRLTDCYLAGIKFVMSDQWVRF